MAEQKKEGVKRHEGLELVWFYTYVLYIRTYVRMLVIYIVLLRVVFFLELIINDPLGFWNIFETVLSIFLVVEI